MTDEVHDSLFESSSEADDEWPAVSAGTGKKASESHAAVENAGRAVPGGGGRVAGNCVGVTPAAISQTRNDVVWGTDTFAEDSAEAEAYRTNLRAAQQLLALADGKAGSWVSPFGNGDGMDCLLDEDKAQDDRHEDDPMLETFISEGRDWPPDEDKAQADRHKDYSMLDTSIDESMEAELYHKHMCAAQQLLVLSLADDGAAGVAEGAALFVEPDPAQMLFREATEAGGNPADVSAQQHHDLPAAGASDVRRNRAPAARRRLGGAVADELGEVANVGGKRKAGELVQPEDGDTGDESFASDSARPTSGGHGGGAALGKKARTRAVRGDPLAAGDGEVTDEPEDEAKVGEKRKADASDTGDESFPSEPARPTSGGHGGGAALGKKARTRAVRGPPRACRPEQAGNDGGEHDPSAAGDGAVTDEPGDEARVGKKRKAEDSDTGDESCSARPPSDGGGGEAALGKKRASAGPPRACGPKRAENDIDGHNPQRPRGEGRQEGCTHFALEHPWSEPRGIPNPATPAGGVPGKGDEAGPRALVRRLEALERERASILAALSAGALQPSPPATPPSAADPDPARPGARGGNATPGATFFAKLSQAALKQRSCIDASPPFAPCSQAAPSGAGDRLASCPPPPRVLSTSTAERGTDSPGSSSRQPERGRPAKAGRGARRPKHPRVKDRGARHLPGAFLSKTAAFDFKPFGGGGGGSGDRALRPASGLPLPEQAGVQAPAALDPGGPGAAGVDPDGLGNLRSPTIDVAVSEPPSDALDPSRPGMVGGDPGERRNLRSTIESVESESLGDLLKRFGPPAADSTDVDHDPVDGPVDAAAGMDPGDRLNIENRGLPVDGPAVDAAAGMDPGLNIENRGLPVDGPTVDAAPCMDPGDRLSIENCGLPEGISDKYRELGVERLFPWQYSCLHDTGALRGENLVYCAPTSGGKTLVAEVLMARRLEAHPKQKILFVLPYVAVVAEKVATLETVFEPLGVTVGTYAAGKGSRLFLDDVCICTIERANGVVNTLLEMGRVEDISMVVIDELHQVADGARGYLLELLVTKILYAHHGALQVVGMSATLSNAPVLASWLRDAWFFATNFRPVPLSESMCLDGVLTVFPSESLGLPPVDEKNGPVATAQARGGQAGDTISPCAAADRTREIEPATAADGDRMLALTLETLRDGHSVLVFCATKKAVEAAAAKIAFFLKHLPPATVPVSADRLATRQRIVQTLQANPCGVDKVLADAILCGVAYHHAGLTFEEREVVESAYRSGDVLAMTCTTTLAAGVNLPARRVLFLGTRIGTDRLTPSRYKQACGRAGRVGLDSVGESVLLAKKADEALCRSLVTGKLAAARSPLNATPHALARAVSDAVASGVAASAFEIQKFVSCSLCAVETPYDELLQATARALQFLETHHFIYFKQPASVFVASPLASATFKSGLSPEEAKLVFESLTEARAHFVMSCDLHLVYHCAPYATGVEPCWGRYHRLYLSLSAEEQSVARIIGINEGSLLLAANREPPKGTPAQAKEAVRLRRFFAAMILNELVREVPLRFVCAKYEVLRGSVQRLMEATAAFAGMVASFAEQLNWWGFSPLIQKIRLRLKDGVEADIVPLMQIPSLKPYHARALYQAGYRSISAVAAAPADHVDRLLSSALPFSTRPNTAAAVPANQAAHQGPSADCAHPAPPVSGVPAGVNHAEAKPSMGDVVVRDAQRALLDDVREKKDNLQTAADALREAVGDTAAAAAAAAGQKGKRVSVNAGFGAARMRAHRAADEPGEQPAEPPSPASAPAQAPPPAAGAQQLGAGYSAGRGQLALPPPVSDGVARHPGAPPPGQTAFPSPVSGLQGPPMPGNHPLGNGVLYRAGMLGPPPPGHTAGPPPGFASQDPQVVDDRQAGSGVVRIPGAPPPGHTAFPLPVSGLQGPPMPGNHPHANGVLYRAGIPGVPPPGHTVPPPGFAGQGPRVADIRQAGSGVAGISGAPPPGHAVFLPPVSGLQGPPMPGYHPHGNGVLYRAGPGAPPPGHTAFPPPISGHMPGTHLHGNGVLYRAGLLGAPPPGQPPPGFAGQGPRAIGNRRAGDGVGGTPVGAPPHGHTAQPPPVFAAGPRAIGNRPAANGAAGMPGAPPPDLGGEGPRPGVPRPADAVQHWAGPQSASAPGHVNRGAMGAPVSVGEGAGPAAQLPRGRAGPQGASAPGHDNRGAMGAPVSVGEGAGPAAQPPRGWAGPQGASAPGHDGAVLAAPHRSAEMDDQPPRGWAAEHRGVAPDPTGAAAPARRAAPVQRHVADRFASLRYARTQARLGGGGGGEGGSSFAVHAVPFSERRGAAEARLEASLRSGRPFAFAFGTPDAAAPHPGPPHALPADYGVAVSFAPDAAFYYTLRENGADDSRRLSVIRAAFDEAAPGPRPAGKVSYDAKTEAKWLVALQIPRPYATLRDPRIASWMISPDDTFEGNPSCTLDVLVKKHLRFTTFRAVDPPLRTPCTSTSACRKAVLSLVLMQHLNDNLQFNGLVKAFHEVEMPLVPVLAEMECVGVLFRKAVFDAHDAEMVEKAQAITQRAHAMTGYAWSLTCPADCARALFDSQKLQEVKVRKVRPPAKAARKRAESRSTSAAVLAKLEQMHPGHPLPGMIREHRLLVGWLAKYVRSIPRFTTQLDSRVRAAMFQTASNTGRLSLTDPNLQTIPHPVAFQSARDDRRITLELRCAFVAPEGHVLVSADYSQIEMRLMAHFSADPVMLAYLRSGGDVFRRIAAKVGKKDPAAVTPLERGMAKAICYGMLYGKGARAISEDLDCGVEEAESFLKDFRGTYAGVTEHLARIVADCRRDGYVETLLGRKRFMAGIYSKNETQRAFAERQAVNTKCQGSAADLVKRAMVMLHRAFDPADARLVLQIHDELLFEVSTRSLDTSLRTIRSVMESAVSLTVPTPISLKVGPSWGELKAVP
eukprot:gene16222-24862_t